MKSSFLTIKPKPNDLQSMGATDEICRPRIVFANFVRKFFFFHFSLQDSLRNVFCNPSGA